LLGLTSGCAGLGGPPPTPVVIVVTATPAPSPAVVVVTATPGPTTAPVAVATSPAATPTPAASKPAVASKPAATPPPATAASKAVASPTSAPAPETLAVGRTNSYRGLMFTVEEARSGQEVEGEKADRGKTLVGLRLQVHNPSGQTVHFAGSPLHGLLRLRLPSGANPIAETEDPFVRPRFEPEATIAGWLYFQVDRPAPLAELALSLGGGQESVVTIPFSGPEPQIAIRRFEYLRSTEPVRGLIWSVSGGELRLDIPGRQANPGQEFIVVNIRATNPSATEVRIRTTGAMPQEGTDYLRIKADNGVLLQVSEDLNKLPTNFPPKAEQDTLYAWQLPHGSKNPSLVILSPDGSEHAIELGPLPPP